MWARVLIYFHQGKFSSKFSNRWDANFRLVLFRTIQNVRKLNLYEKLTCMPRVHFKMAMADKHIMTTERECVVRGYHIYKEIWAAAIGEILNCQAEPGNQFDRYSVAVLKNSTPVGHLPKKLSCVFSLFIRRGGTIQCQVTGPRKYSSDLQQGGLEIPRVLILRGKQKI